MAAAPGGFEIENGLDGGISHFLFGVFGSEPADGFHDWYSVADGNQRYMEEVDACVDFDFFVQHHCDEERQGDGASIVGEQGGAGVEIALQVGLAEYFGGFLAHGS